MALGGRRVLPCSHGGGSPNALLLRIWPRVEACGRPDPRGGDVTVWIDVGAASDVVAARIHVVGAGSALVVAGLGTPTTVWQPLVMAHGGARNSS